MNIKKTYRWQLAGFAALLYIILFVVPSILSIYYSMTNWNVSSDNVNFVGLDNFVNIFSKGNYIKYIGRTVYFAIITSIAKCLIGLALALVLNRSLRTKNILRTIFFLPIVISPLIIGIIFNSVLHPHGVLNGFLDTVGIEGISWLTDIKTAFASVMGVETWRYMGFNMAIFLAGMQMIDNSYYEAASIDGAGAVKKFFHITIPFLMPSITINFVLNIMNGLRVFDVVFTLTKGGPGDLTDVLNTVIFREYATGRYGFSTALGVVLFLITAVLSFAVYRFFSKKEVEL